MAARLLAVVLATVNFGWRFIFDLLLDLLDGLLLARLPVTVARLIVYRRL